MCTIKLKNYPPQNVATAYFEKENGTESRDKTFYFFFDISDLIS